MFSRAGIHPGPGRAAADSAPRGVRAEIRQPYRPISTGFVRRVVPCGTCGGRGHVEQQLEVGAHHTARGGRWFRGVAGGAGGELTQVLVFLVVPVQGACEGVEDGGARPRLLAPRPGTGRLSGHGRPPGPQGPRPALTSAPARAARRTFHSRGPPPWTPAATPFFDPRGPGIVTCFADRRLAGPPEGRRPAAERPRREPLARQVRGSEDPRTRRAPAGTVHVTGDRPPLTWARAEGTRGPRSAGRCRPPRPSRSRAVSRTRRRGCTTAGPGRR